MNFFNMVGRLGATAIFAVVLSGNVFAGSANFGPLPPPPLEDGGFLNFGPLPPPPLEDGVRGQFGPLPPPPLEDFGF